MKKYAIIAAAGLGTRMGNPIPKQFLDILGKPVLIHSVDAFTAAFNDISIILVVHPLHLHRAENLIRAAGHLEHTTLVEGGETRSASVRRGLEQVHGDGIVLVHDAARCSVSPELIRKCFDEAVRSGTAIPVVPVTDSVRMITDNGSVPVDRGLLRLVQTPQAFQSQLLKDAYALSPDNDFTDDASVLERAGMAIKLIEGEATNLKITWPTDLILASQIRKDFNA